MANTAVSSPWPKRATLDFDAALLETLYVLRRGGAAFIVTYGARRARALGLP